MAKVSRKRQKNPNNSNENETGDDIKITYDDDVAKTASKANNKRTRKSVPRVSPPLRSSVYRGVTRHRWTGRYEAHLWDKNCWNDSQNKKGRQVYLGAYDDEEAAAHAYDLAALKYWGQDTILNFPSSTYVEELKEMEGQTKEEYIGSLRRKSSGFSRGVSKYRGVARHHHNGRWEARIGRVLGNKYLYLGTYATQEEAATAYDMAAIEYRGLNAVTNFDLSRYVKWLRPNDQNSSDNNKNNNNKGNPNDNFELNPNGDSSSSTLNPNYIHELEFTSSPSSEGSWGVEPVNDDVVGGGGTALGLLLQSSKFKEMLERTTSSVANSSRLSTPSPIKSELDPPRGGRSFPEDIQTYFDCQEYSRSYTDDGDHILFGDLGNTFDVSRDINFDIASEYLVHKEIT